MGVYPEGVVTHRPGSPRVAAIRKKVKNCWVTNGRSWTRNLQDNHQRSGDLCCFIFYPTIFYLLRDFRTLQGDLFWVAGEARSKTSVPLCFKSSASLSRSRFDRQVHLNFAVWCVGQYVSFDCAVADQATGGSSRQTGRVTDSLPFERPGGLVPLTEVFFEFSVGPMRTYRNAFWLVS